MGSSTSAEKYKEQTDGQSEALGVEVPAPRRPSAVQAEQKLKDKDTDSPQAIAVHPIPAQTVWDSFFNVCFRLTEQLLRQGLITRDNIEDRDAFIYLGLVGATVMETNERSLGVKDGFALAIGQSITAETCPHEHAAFYTQMMALKQQRLTAQLTIDEVTALRKVVVYASAEDKPNVVVEPPPRQVVVMRLAASVQSLATMITQFADFRKHFDRNLDLLLTATAEEKATGGGSATKTGSGSGSGAADTPSAAPSVVLDGIWSSFFGTVYHTADRLVGSGLIKAAEMKAASREPRLMSALAGVVVLDAVKRSLQVDGIKLAAGGDIISADKCPLQHRPFFDALLKLKALVVVSKASDAELLTLQQMALLTSTDYSKLSFSNSDRKLVLSQISQTIQAIVKPLTQTVFFEAQMKQVLDLWCSSSHTLEALHDDVVQCASCTFHNEADATICAVCGAKLG